MAKAFLTHWLPETETKPAKIKVSFEQKKSIVYSVSKFNCNQSIPRQAIEQFMLDSWMTVRPFFIGQLPNGDHCGVFK